MSERSDLDRLIDLETRQAFQDDSIASLNQALVSQQQRIDQLEKLLELMAERLRESELDVDPPPEEPPPHY